MSNGDASHEEEGTWHNRDGTQVFSAQGRTSILPLYFPPWTQINLSPGPRTSPFGHQTESKQVGIQTA